MYNWAIFNHHSVFFSVCYHQEFVHETYSGDLFQNKDNIILLLMVTNASVAKVWKKWKLFCV